VIGFTLLFVVKGIRDPTATQTTGVDDLLSLLQVFTYQSRSSTHHTERIIPASSDITPHSALQALELETSAATPAPDKDEQVGGDTTRDMREDKGESKPKSKEKTGPVNPTTMDRYPPLFHALQSLIAANDSKAGSENKTGNDSNISLTSQRVLKILSFGCGEHECQSLREYFPHAHIDGVDIDASLIKRNAANNSDALIQYFNSPSQLPLGSYDAVLALDVLCGKEHSGSILPYKEFYNTMMLLDGLVKPGGYLVTYNSNYPFSEFPGAVRYKSMATGCSEMRSTSVLTLDEKWFHSSNPKWKFHRGSCTAWGKYCFESGWVKKVDHQGRQLQPQVAGLMSFGCLYPGTFFRKLESIEEFQSNQFRNTWDRIKERPDFWLG
jgi:hypothetical protein